MRKKGTYNRRPLVGREPGVQLDSSHKCSGCPMYHRENIRLFCPLPGCIREEINKYMGR